MKLTIVNFQKVQIFYSWIHEPNSTAFFEFKKVQKTWKTHVLGMDCLSNSERDPYNIPDLGSAHLEHVPLTL